jgi:hypothetical protein
MFRFAQHDSVIFSRHQSQLLKIVGDGSVKSAALAGPASLRPAILERGTPSDHHAAAGQWHYLFQE